jgi:hypothetical protein
MRWQVRRNNYGRADPLGLLVVAVVLALTVTIGIQTQAAVSNGQGAGVAARCDMPCMTTDMLR